MVRWGGAAIALVVRLGLVRIWEAHVSRFKSSLFFGPVAFAALCTSFAQTPGGFERIGYPVGAAGDLFFRTLSSIAATDYSAAIVKVREVTGVDDDKARHFLMYVSAGIQDMKDIGPQLVAATCAERAQLLDLAKLHEEMVRSDNKLEAQREQVVRNSESALGREGTERLVAWLMNHHKNDKYITNNYMELLPRQKLTPETFLSRLCDRTSVSR